MSECCLMQMEDACDIAEVRDETHGELLWQEDCTAVPEESQKYGATTQWSGVDDMKNAAEITCELVAKVEQWLLLHPKEGFQHLFDEAVMMGKQLHAQMLSHMFVPAHVHADVLAHSIEGLFNHCVEDRKSVV